MSLLAFDIGGTAVKYGIWENENLIDVNKFPTPDTWDEMKETIQHITEKQKGIRHVEGVAFSFPGTVNDEKGVIQGISAIPYIHQFPIYQELSEALQVPISMENDANCAALAEVWCGAARHCNNVLFVVIGTGIGGAIITNGILQRGAHICSGEFGSMILDDGKSFSKLGTAANMARRFSSQREGTYTGEQVFQLADDGDELAEEEVNTFYHYLTLGLYNLQCIFDPEKIILGGGITAKEGLLDEINERMHGLLEENDLVDVTPTIELCQFKNNANLIGAVSHFLDKS